jgi:hypothetical protein
MKSFRKDRKERIWRINIEDVVGYNLRSFTHGLGLHLCCVVCSPVLFHSKKIG